MLPTFLQASPSRASFRQVKHAPCLPYGDWLGKTSLGSPVFLLPGSLGAMVLALWSRQWVLGLPSGWGLSPHTCRNGQGDVMARVPSTRASPWGPEGLLTYRGSQGDN